MKKIKFLALSLIILSFTNLKAAESIMGSVEGMFCIECQKKLAKAFKDEFGSNVSITVSWEKGLAIVSVPSDGKICLLYTSPSPRDRQKSRMPSSA